MWLLKTAVKQTDVDSITIVGINLLYHNEIYLKKIKNKKYIHQVAHIYTPMYQYQLWKQILVVDMKTNLFTSKIYLKINM